MAPRYTALSVLLIAAAGMGQAAWGVEIPSAAPNDAIMASAVEIQGVQNWAARTFYGGSGGSVNSFLSSSTLPFSFNYGGAASSTLLPNWQRNVTTASQSDRTVHTVTWTDPATSFAVVADVTVYSNYPGVDWVLRFQNNGTATAPVVNNVQAVDLSLNTTLNSQSGVLYDLAGDGSNSNSFMRQTASLSAGGSISRSPTGGRSSNTTAFPFFNYRQANQGVVAAVGWSGQWAASLSGSTNGTTQMKAGMDQTNIRLQPGESFRTPRTLLMPYQGSQLTADQRFRRLMMYQYAPKPTGTTPARLPIAQNEFDRYNSRAGWATEAGQLTALNVAHSYGADYWLDAAWFPGGFPNGVGNWSANPTSFPNGLKPLGDAARANGQKFVLWFEPERVASGSQIAVEHPEFVIGGSNGGLFNLANPAARTWMTNLLSQRITQWGVDVLRMDFNMDPLSYWNANEPADRRGMTQAKYVEGLYTMWDDLRAQHPGLLLDSCASGGRRIDLETMSRAVTLSRSDTVCLPGRQTWDQNQTLGLSQFIPFFSSFSWSPDAYTTRSAATAGLVTQYDYLDSTLDVAKATAAVDEIRENQKYWYGDFYPLTQAGVDDALWAAYQLNRSDLGEGMVMAFRRPGSSTSTMTFALGGIDPTSEYQVTFIDELRNQTKMTMLGSELGQLQIQLSQAGSSLLVRYAMVPEPGSLAILGTALLGLLAYVWRRHK
jgi:alpha-galactosidase